MVLCSIRNIDWALYPKIKLFRICIRLHIQVDELFWNQSNVGVAGVGGDLNLESIAITIRLPLRKKGLKLYGDLG